MVTRPNTVIGVFFEGGNVTINSMSSRASVEDLFRGDKDGMVKLKSVSEAFAYSPEAKERARSERRALDETEADYVIVDEEVFFHKDRPLFWSISVTKDPPKIKAVKLERV